MPFHTLIARRLFALLLALLLAGCGVLARQAFQREHGEPDPQRYDKPLLPSGKISYQTQIKPILDSRCVACHACYDAPCQLKLGSWEGIARGLTSARVYDAARFSEAPMTRLFTDGHKASDWRDKGFSPVLNEYENSAAGNLSNSLLYRALALKQTHPLPAVDILPKSFDFSLDREQSCPRIDSFDHYASDNPLAGMPYGLPGISREELELIGQWLAEGAADDGPPAASAAEQHALATWEKFLNGDSNKEQLMSRYLYEHLFLAHLYLTSESGRNAYRIVRSSTPPGQDPVAVQTRRPFDAPGVPRVYYRLMRDLEPIVAKTHMPYQFDEKRLARLRQLFMTPAYPVERLPSYAPESAANPLLTFHDIPADSRYRFMLDDAQFFVMNFIKGPVCRGQIALNVIEDRFWVFFVDPVIGVGPDAGEIALREIASMTLPAATSSEASIIGPWRAYAKQEKHYRRVRAAYLESMAKIHGGPTLDLVWDGERKNPAAALTVLRNFDSATVLTGLLGEPPKTAWLIGYPLFERVYYLLAAGFDVYGNLAHQLHSRLFMDFLRMEGEANFIALLPKERRAALVAEWYRNAREDSVEQMESMVLESRIESAIAYRSDNPKHELFALLAERMGPGLDRRLSLSSEADSALRTALMALAGVRGRSLDWLPESSFMRITDATGAPRYFTLLRDTGHLNVTRLLREKSELAPAENALTVVPGLIGAYPNAIYRLSLDELPAFAAMLAALASEGDYRRLAERFAVRRTSSDFWSVSDDLHRAARLIGQADGGLFDYNRLENR
jgi:hypothetical protein